MAPPMAGERTVVPSFSTDDDLDKAWADMIARCNKKFEWDLNDHNVSSVDQILQIIGPPQPSKPSKRDTAWKVVKSTLVCVKRFGDAVAPIAGAAFGPSQQCMNAITFVITACQDYDAVFDNIAILMERVSVFMENLKMHLDRKDAEVKLDRNLRSTVYRVLEHFLTIMGIAHKLTRGWKGKFKLALKVGAFGEDEGVKDALAKLETLVLDVTKAQITTLVLSMSDAAQNLRSLDRKVDDMTATLEKNSDALEKTNATLGHLDSAEQRRSADEEEKKRLKDIREALGIDLNNRPWVDRQDDLWGNHTAGTGQWLLNMSQFTRWADPRQSHVNVLSVRAAEGFGKSFLCSIVVNHLQNRHREDPKIGIAYYYTQRDAQEATSTSSGSSQRSFVVNKVLKALFYQLASATTPLGREYSRLIQKACDNKSEFGKTADLWKRLVTDVARNLDATFYFVVDGIDEAESETGKPLSKILNEVISPDPSTQLKIRLFFTGRPGGFEAMNMDIDPSKPIPEINIQPKDDKAALNEEDILLFAQKKLDDMKIFESDDAEIAALKARAKLELGQGVRGDYTALNYQLNDLRKCRSTREVEVTLRTAQSTRTELVSRKIDQLNETLSKEEIDEVNKILLWANAAFESLSIQVYEAVLRLNADTKSLISLEQQVLEKYFSLFNLSDTKVLTFQTDDIVTCLQSKDETSSPKGTGGREVTKALQESEIALVKRILKTHFVNIFGGDDMYEKFAFDEFFESKLGEDFARVRLLSDVECHVRAAQGCLLAMCDHTTDEDFSALHVYAWEWFAEHLKSADIKETDIATKQDIGRKLVRILREISLIDEWWSEDRIRFRSFWVFINETTVAVYKWLKDPIVQKGLSDMPTERAWVTEVTASEGSEVRILANVAKRIAEHWFNRRGSLEETSAWLYGYLGHIQGSDPKYSDTISAQRVEEIEVWAKGVLGNDSESAKWHSCMADTLRGMGHAKEAVPRYRLAMELLPEEWSLTFGLAQALTEADDTEVALKTVEDLIERSQDLLISDEKFKTEYWEKILDKMCDWNLELKRFETAEQLSRKMIDEGAKRDTYETFASNGTYNMVFSLFGQAKYKEIIDLLADLKSHKDGENSDRSRASLLRFSHSADLNDRIVASAHQIDQTEMVYGMYQDAIDIAKGDKDQIDNYLSLRCHQARLILSRPSKEEQEAAVDSWEDVMAYDVPEGYDNYYVRSARQWAAPRLAMALLNLARQAGLSMPLNKEASDYASRLEKLTQGDAEIVQSGWKNTKLSLARLHSLAGDTARAKADILDFFKLGVENLEDGDIHGGAYRMAVTFQALDDDVNAVAAWSLFEPEKPKESSDEDSASSAGSSEGGGDESGAETSDTSATAEDPDKSETALKQTNTNAEVEKSTEEADADKPDAADVVNTATTTDDAANSTVEGTTEDTSTATEPSGETKLKGALPGSYCDGRCGHEWTYIDDLYCCKDCLDLQLDPECYAKLQEGALAIAVCSTTHSHLHLPAFDRERWEKTPQDYMWVGEEMMLKKDWIERIKKEWKIDAESLKAKEKSVAAAKKIRKAWNTYKIAAKP